MSASPFMPPTEVMRVRRRRQEPTDGQMPATIAPDDFPATPSPDARLEALVAELLRRDEARTAALARIEATIGEVLTDLGILKDRLDDGLRP